MKLRTVEELEDQLNNDLIWRKRELAQPVKLLSSGITPEVREYVCRSSIAILYAHWEGFIKKCVECYVNFVQTRRPVQSAIIDTLRIYGSRTTIQSLKSSQSVQLNDLEVLMNLLSPETQRFESGKIEVDTKSNLGEKQTMFLLRSIGYDLERLPLKTANFDKLILDRRNTVSHGSYITIKENEVRPIRDSLLEDMMNIKDEIIDMANSKKYLKILHR